MNKNPIGANFTGTWSKRSKKFYSDADAWRYYFKPDHSEFYGEWYKKPNKSNLWNKAKDKVDEYIDLDIIHVPWAASVRRSTSKKIVEKAFIDPYKNDDLWDISIIPDEPNLEEIYWFSDIHKNKKTIANNKVTMSPTILHNYSGDSDFKFDPDVKKTKNMLAKNRKNKSNYRHRQEFQQIWGYNTMDQEVSEYDIMEDARTEAGKTKSELEDILATKPHIVWSRKDEKQLNRLKHRKAA